MPLEISDEEYEELMERANDPNRPLPSAGMPLGERTLAKLLDPDIPNTKSLADLWIFSGPVARHVELTNIPTPEAHKKLRRRVTDIMRVKEWDADEYAAERMARFVFCDILAGKSIGYTRHSRERDALNENRITQSISAGRPDVPKDSGGGFLSFLKRG